LPDGPLRPTQPPGGFLRRVRLLPLRQGQAIFETVKAVGDDVEAFPDRPADDVLELSFVDALAHDVGGFPLPPVDALAGADAAVVPAVSGFFLDHVVIPRVLRRSRRPSRPFFRFFIYKGVGLCFPDVRAPVTSGADVVTRVHEVDPDAGAP
jgi:hypothetical protein